MRMTSCWFYLFSFCVFIIKELGNLQKLQLLDLSENLIFSLPQNISGLINLSDLNVSQNSLSCLPDTFGK